MMNEGDNNKEEKRNWSILGITLLFYRIGYWSLKMMMFGIVSTTVRILVSMFAMKILVLVGGAVWSHIVILRARRRPEED